MIRYWMAKVIGHFPPFRGQNRIVSLLYPEGAKPRIQKILRIKGTGRFIYADTHSHIGWNNIVFGCYEQKSISMMKSLLKNKRKKVALDIGANIGHYSLILSDLCENVYSFEPVDEFIKRFQKNIELNRISNIEICTNALGNKIEAAEMAVLATRGGSQTALLKTEHSKFHEAFGWTFQNASTETLDHFVEKKNLQEIDYIKIDVDGSEPEVLLGGINSLKKFKPIIQIEINEKGANSAFQILTSLDYSIMDVNGRSINKDSCGNFFGISAK